MTTPTTLYTLVNVRYNEPNHEIVCTFACGSQFKSQRFAFFPVLLTMVPSEKLSKLFSVSQLKQIQFSENPHKTTQIIGASFSVLQSVQQQLEKESPGSTLLLSCERQFLLQQNWGLWNGFVFDSANWTPIGLTLPDHSLGFLSQSFKSVLEELLTLNETKTARTLCESIVWSSLLGIGLDQLPCTDSQRWNEWVHNQFFLSGKLVCDKPLQTREKMQSNFPLRVFENTTEFDFSDCISWLCSRQNLGLETINCSCCAPANASAPNLFSDSLVAVRITTNAFFFDSFFPDFAHAFHRQKPEQAAREQRQKAFGLNVPPVGPFFAGQLVECPLADAEQIEQQGHGLIVGLAKSVFWHCTQTDSGFSRTLEQYSRQLDILQKRNADLEKKALAADQLCGLHALKQNPHFFFQKTAHELLSKIFQQAPNAFVHPLVSNHFFSGVLARSIVQLRSFVLARFVAFSGELGFRGFSSALTNKAFVQDSSGFGLAHSFAKTQNFPQPQVTDWHFWLSKEKATNR